MKTNQELARRFREVILNGTWVANTNYKDQLKELNWRIATTSFNSLNSIAVLTQHIHYYNDGINIFFKTGSLTIKDKFSFDFPAIESQNDWENFLIKFWDSSETFAAHIEQMTDEQLQQFFFDEKYGSY